MLFNADIRQSVTLEEVNFEKKVSKKTLLPRSLYISLLPVMLFNAANTLEEVNLEKQE